MSGFVLRQILSASSHRPRVRRMRRVHRAGVKAGRGKLASQGELDRGPVGAIHQHEIPSGQLSLRLEPATLLDDLLDLRVDWHVMGG